MSHDDGDGSDAIDALVRGLPDTAPPEGFAERVMAAKATAQRRRWFLAGAAAAPALAAAAALLVTVRFSSAPFDGQVPASATRQTASLGSRAVAVVEPGATLRFTVDDGGAVRVTQPSGRAFYRVDPGADLAVTTPAGTARVHGTCFTVDVSPATRIETGATPMIQSPLGKHLATTAIGAVAGAALVVVVYEGRVTVDNAHGQVMVAPGEQATATAESAPLVAAWASTAAPDGVRLRAENDRLRAALSAAQAAASGDAQGLLAENQALRAKLARADEELALVDEVRRAEEGKPVPFPAELPARFREDDLRKSFDAALEEAGVQGGVVQIDCAEFPCIVYGQLTAREDMEKVRKSKALAAYEKDSNSTSVWAVRKEGVGQAYFGVALHPDGPDDPNTEKRIENRMKSGWEQIRPPREPINP